MVSVEDSNPKTGIEYIILKSVYVSMQSNAESLNYSDHRKFIFDIKDYLDGIIEPDLIIPQIKDIWKFQLNNEEQRKIRKYLKNLDLPYDRWHSALIEATPKIERMLNGNYE